MALEWGVVLQSQTHIHTLDFPRLQRFHQAVSDICWLMEAHTAQCLIVMTASFIHFSQRSAEFNKISIYLDILPCWHWPHRIKSAAVALHCWTKPQCVLGNTWWIRCLTSNIKPDNPWRFSFSNTTLQFSVFRASVVAGVVLWPSDYLWHLKWIGSCCTTHHVIWQRKRQTLSQNWATFCQQVFVTAL